MTSPCEGSRFESHTRPAQPALRLSMPELPEVETMVRGIRPSIEGRMLVAVRACGCLCRPILLEPNIRRMAKLAEGRRVTAVRRRAKRVVLDLEGGSAFVIEPRMTGTGKYEMKTLDLREDTDIDPAIAEQLIREAIKLNHPVGNPTARS